MMGAKTRGYKSTREYSQHNNAMKWEITFIQHKICTMIDVPPSYGTNNAQKRQNIIIYVWMAQKCYFFTDNIISLARRRTWWIYIIIIEIINYFVYCDLNINDWW